MVVGGMRKPHEPPKRTKRNRIDPKQPRPRRPRIAPHRTQALVERLFRNDLHAKQVLSLGNATVGVLHAASLAIHAIGLGLASAMGLRPKHTTKQVDRLLSNGNVNVWALFATWVPFIIGSRDEVVVAMDWTEFDLDGQSTIAIYLVTRHGRATPLVWKTVPKAEITEGNRPVFEDEVIRRLHEVMPRDVRVTLLADRGFGDQQLYEFLDDLGWHFVIRFRENIFVYDAQGEGKPARDWLSPTGRARRLQDVEVTNDRTYVPAVVVVHAKGMKDAWCLATNRTDLTASQVVKLYGKRFTIEETFRDIKDARYGMGLYATHISDPGRRDRLLFIAVLAQALLTLLGAASEAVGFDRWLKVNTAKKRTHSLFRQGLYWYSAIPNLPKRDLRRLMAAFDHILTEHALIRDTFGVL